MPNPDRIHTTTTTKRWMATCNIVPGQVIELMGGAPHVVGAIEEHPVGKTGVVVFKIWLRHYNSRSTGFNIARLGHEFLELSDDPTPDWWSDDMGSHTGLVTS